MVVGTLGYLAPEYAECGKASTKTDVHAFGVVVLQLITGMRTTDRRLGGKSLVGWVTTNYLNAFKCLFVWMSLTLTLRVPTNWLSPIYGDMWDNLEQFFFFFENLNPVKQTTYFSCLLLLILRLPLRGREVKMRKWIVLQGKIALNKQFWLQWYIGEKKQKNNMEDKHSSAYQI